MNNFKPVFNFLKIFSVCCAITAFFSLTILGTPAAGKHDLIMAHILGEKSLVNAFGAFGTVLAALAFISFAVAIIISMHNFIMEDAEQKTTFGDILGFGVILIISLLMLTYSSTVMYYGLVHLKDAYNCEIYGFDTIVVCIGKAFSLKAPLVIGGIILLVVVYFKRGYILIKG